MSPHLGHEREQARVSAVRCRGRFNAMAELRSARVVLRRRISVVRNFPRLCGISLELMEGCVGHRQLSNTDAGVPTLSASLRHSAEWLEPCTRRHRARRGDLVQRLSSVVGSGLSRNLRCGFQSEECAHERAKLVESWQWRWVTMACNSKPAGDSCRTGAASVHAAGTRKPGADDARSSPYLLEHRVRRPERRSGRTEKARGGRRWCHQHLQERVRRNGRKWRTVRWRSPDRPR